MVNTIYVEIVSGKNEGEMSIVKHAIDPTNETPIICLGEDFVEVPIVNRRIIKVEIEKNIVKRFIEDGFKPQSQKGLRLEISDNEVLVIGEPFIKIPTLK